ncbi:MAG: hypothetical protein FJ387_24170 [Verrucomicrobia bacterium]|nr:hypothetical protein [Verrucomicrobiota bacterium]
MNTENRVVEATLRRTAASWRWLRLLQHTFTLGALGTLSFLGLAVAILRGWLGDQTLAVGWVVTTVAVLLGLWLILLVTVLAWRLRRNRLAGAVESSQPKLLDRIHTLVAFERDRTQPDMAPFYTRIAAQAAQVLSLAPPKSPYRPWRTLAHAVVFLALVVGTCWLYQEYSPWQRLAAAHRAQRAAQTPEAPPPSLDLGPPQDVVEAKRPWGEVRITEPARDLRVTKVDVVPLQIEAAANEPLAAVAWFSARNGAAEQPHPLPAPTEPRYAVYQPLVYLDEFTLSDWDVLTYYAQATTSASNAFASDVYFLEVRPFREDILKLPGGSDGPAMQCLNGLSALIAQQQHVIRQTHQHLQHPPPTAKLRAQDLRKLAAAEADLAQATQHLYARLALSFENRPIGEALDRLAAAQQALEQASRSLETEATSQAQTDERTALAELVAARKAFQKTVTEHPKEFAEPTPEEPPPLAELKAQLKEIAEFRDEQKAAQEFLEGLVQRQKAILDRIQGARPADLPKLAEDEQQLRQALEDFAQQHPQVFKPVPAETEATTASLQAAAQALEQRHNQAKPLTQDALAQLEKLTDALRRQSTERQLADAYRLKRALDRQTDTFSQCQSAGPGAGPSDSAMRQTATATRDTLQQLKAVAEQSPTRELFGPELRDALSELSLMSLHWPLSELERGTSPDRRPLAAGEVREGLERISQAFETSQPQALQTARRAAQSDAQTSEAFEQGMAQLASLIRSLERPRSLSPQQQAQQSQEALANLQDALREPAETAGSNERSRELLSQLERALRPGERSPDLETLRRLLAALEAFSVELLSQRPPAGVDPTVTSLDPSRLPAAYRGRIDTYFRRLSEPSR